MRVGGLGKGGEWRQHLASQEDKDVSGERRGGWEGVGRGVST